MRTPGARREREKAGIADKITGFVYWAGRPLPRAGAEPRIEGLRIVVMKSLRRLLAVVLLAAPVLEAGAAVFSLSAAPEMCKGHVCFCPPRPSARGQSCHEGMEHDTTAMTGACHHDHTTAAMAATTPYLLSAAPALPGVQESGPAPLVRTRDQAVGHVRIPLLPPRTA